MTGRRQAVGAAAEAAVARWYEQRGWEVVARNWRTRRGELDLVLRRSGMVVVCEVKARSTDAFGAPVEAISAAKRRRLRSLTGEFLAAHPHPGHSVRIDVASVRPGGVAPQIDVVEGAC